MGGYLIGVHRLEMISPEGWKSLKGPQLLQWRDGFGRNGWECMRRLDSLVSDGKAIDFGSNGYPSRYAITAKELRARLLINSAVDQAAIDECPPNQWLIIDAWDES